MENAAISFVKRSAEQIRSLFNKTQADAVPQSKPDLIQENFYDNEPRHVANRLILSELVRRGHRAELLGRTLVCRVNGSILLFDNAYSSLMSRTALRLAGNKDATKKVLSLQGLQVAKGKAFRTSDETQAWAFCQRLSSSVIKPTTGIQGKGVSVGVKSKDQFDIAWKHACAHAGSSILIEEEFVGEEARYLVVGNKCVAVYQKLPPMIVGDGKLSVGELVEKKNAYRALHPHFSSRLIYMTHGREKHIQSQGYSLQCIPPPNTAVYIDTMSSISSGGDTREITDLVHDQMKKVAETAALAIPGGDILGLDIISTDHTAAPTVGSYIIIEINTRPGVGGHNKPAYGKPQNVIPSIVENSERILHLRSNYLGAEGEDETPQQLAGTLSGSRIKLNVDSKQIAGPFKFYALEGEKLITHGDRVDEATPFIRRRLSHKLILDIVARDAGFNVFPGQSFTLQQKDAAKHFSDSLRLPTITPLNHDYTDLLGQGEQVDFEKAWDTSVDNENTALRSLPKGVLVSPRVMGGKSIRALLCFGKIIGCVQTDNGRTKTLKPDSRISSLLVDLASSLPYPDFLEATIHISKLGSSSVATHLSSLSFDIDFATYRHHYSTEVQAALNRLIRYRSSDIYRE